jgi:hypothetical protein
MEKLIERSNSGKVHSTMSPQHADAADEITQEVLSTLNLPEVGESFLLRILVAVNSVPVG